MNCPNCESERIIEWSFKESKQVRRCDLLCKNCGHHESEKQSINEFGEIEVFDELLIKEGRDTSSLFSGLRGV